MFFLFISLVTHLLAFCSLFLPSVHVSISWFGFAFCANLSSEGVHLYRISWLPNNDLLFFYNAFILIAILYYSEIYIKVKHPLHKTSRLHVHMNCLLVIWTSLLKITLQAWYVTRPSQLFISFSPSVPLALQIHSVREAPLAWQTVQPFGSFSASTLRHPNDCEL